MEMRSSSSLRALIRIGRQKRSTAFLVWPCESNHCWNDCPVSRCWVSVKGTRARAMEILSAEVRNENPKNDGAVWSGAGREDDFIFEVRPPGSMNVISSYQRIWLAIPMRS